MTRHQTALLRQILLALDVAVSAMAFLAALRLRAALADGALADLLPIAELGRVEGIESYNKVLLGMLPLWALAFHWSKTSDFRSSLPRIAGRYLRAVGVGIAMLVVASFWLHLGFLSRAFVLLFAMFQVGLLVLVRLAIVEAIKRGKQVDDHRVLVVGCGPEAVAFARSLRERGAWNNRFLGHVCIPGEVCDAAAQPRRGDLNQLEKLLDTEVVDEVVFAARERPLHELEPALGACNLRGVDVLMQVPNMPSSGHMEIANVTGFDMPLLGYSRAPTGELRLMGKRLLDIVGALAAIIVFMPVMIATAIAIRLESPGPILFRQVRSGKNGRKFVMYKFRSMCADAERKKAELLHLNEMDGPVFKIRRDPRITRVGAFIRKSSIDELPQFFNVLLGTMSMVGPRPPLPSEVAQYEPWQRRRLSVRPGITGMWQVSGRNAIDFQKWMELDLAYIDNWSLWLDLKILFRTLPAVIARSGAS
jgi:exopolysaccharide biosynthesis polyprenyl glycosylphosphotransferase